MASVMEKINDDIVINAAAGVSYTRDFSRSTSIMTNIDSTGVPNAFLPNNSNYIRPGSPNGSATSATDSYDNRNWSTAIFATASIGFRDMIYLDGSYRLEWAKSFQQFSGKNNKYLSFDFYSVGANVLLDRILKLDAEKINQLKIRGSYSLVGNPIPNQLFGRQSVDFGSGAISPRPPIFENPKPEETTSYEAGAEVWLLNNTLSFDVTYYNSLLKNQFLHIGLSSGETKPANTGKIRNYGV